jgi:hypothetical protein
MLPTPAPPSVARYRMVALGDPTKVSLEGDVTLMVGAFASGRKAMVVRRVRSTPFVARTMTDEAPDPAPNANPREAVAVTPCWALMALVEVVDQPDPPTLPMTASLILEWGSLDVDRSVNRPDVPARNHTLVPRATASPLTSSTGTWGAETSVHTIAVRATVALPARS